MDKDYLPCFGYLALEGFKDKLLNELKEIRAQYGNLFLSPTLPEKVFFAQNIWYEPFLAKCASISVAANQLKKLQRNWSLYPYNCTRRALLIQEKLPYLSKKPLVFPSVLPKLPLGSWTLLDNNTILGSAKCSSFFPNGKLNFQECKIGPPSRAYLKLWEIFTLLQKMPKKGDVCLELGASPGSWTWVLANLEANVYCIDRANLAPQIENNPCVHFQKGDAFSLTPQDFPKISWLFSDLICYPAKLYEWVLPWLDVCDNFICTLKFQGKEADKAIDYFKTIPNSQLIHLSHNKNELTWVRLKDSSL